MSEFNRDQERLRQAILDELEANGGDLLTSQLRDSLFAEHAPPKTKERSFHRHLLRIAEKMERKGDIKTKREHTSSSRPELRWVKQ